MLSKSLKIMYRLSKGSSYGASTTHFGKLKPRIDGRGAGGCPILVFAIKPEAIVK